MTAAAQRTRQGTRPKLGLKISAGIGRGMGPARVALFAAALLIAAAPKPAAPAPGPAKPAGAAKPSGVTPPGISANGPIDVSADGMENFHDEGRTVYVGNVETLQGQARIRSPRVTMFSKRKPPGTAPNPNDPNGAFGSIERIEAEGPVYYVTPQEQVKGDHGTYLAADDTITVTGDVTVVQGQDVMHGDKLVIEQKTGHSTMITYAPGKGPQRVRGVFFPNQPTGTAASTTKAAPPAPTPARTK